MKYHHDALTLGLIILIIMMVFIAGCTNTSQNQGITTIQSSIPTTISIPVPTASLTNTTTVPLTDPELTGEWNLKTDLIAWWKKPFLRNVKINATFNNSGTLQGFGGCNWYMTNYTLTGETTEYGKTIAIGPTIRSTMMSCTVNNDLEGKYLGILLKTNTYSITNDTMLLRNSSLYLLSFQRA